MRGMHTEAILQAIAKKPGIRAVEIADQVDCEVEAVERSIFEEIQAGKIRREIITAPNGRPTCAFWLKDEPVAPVQVLAAEKLEGPPAATPVPEPAAAPTRRAPVAGPSKVDLAMDFLRSRPTQKATDAELREVMGLTAGQTPATHLARKRLKFEVHKDGRYWKLGPRTLVTEAERGVISEALNNAFRCAVWSDGELHLARGETTVMRLTPAETQKLRMFLANAVVAP